MDLLPVIIFVIIGITAGLVLLGVSQLLGAKNNLKRKNDIYESGVDPIGSASRRYDIKFYLTAILFLLFDVEIVFLFPWALSYKHSSNPSFLMIEFFIFFAILIAAYAFIILAKALEWEK